MIKYFDSTDENLRDLLLLYKSNEYTIEEAINQINNKISVDNNNIPYKVFIFYIIPKIIERYSINFELWHNNKSRDGTVVKYAQMLMYTMIVDKFGGEKSLAEIGRIVRDKNHATVIHARKTIQGYLDMDNSILNFNQEYKEFKNYLNQLHILWIKQIKK